MALCICVCVLEHAWLCVCGVHAWFSVCVCVCVCVWCFLMHHICCFYRHPQLNPQAKDSGKLVHKIFMNPEV